MNFKKDILLIDTEFTGFDLKKHELVQVAAVLLDKKTLKEKKSFNSYIRPAKWKYRNRESMQVNRLTWDMLKSAPSLKEVLREFDSSFNPEKVIQAFYVGYNDKRFLLDAYQQAGLKWRFDYHYLELWGLFFPFMAVKGKLRSKRYFAGFGLETMMKNFKVTSSSLHDALADCRVEAELFRKVIKELK